MASINKAIIIGNLGRDPELRYTGGGVAVCSLNVATTRTYTNRLNDRVEETEWHKITVWGKQAESCNTHLAKGRQVYVEGRIATRSYDDKDGNKKYVTEIVADVVQFLGSRDAGGPSFKPKPEQKPAEHDYIPPSGDAYDDVPF